MNTQFLKLGDKVRAKTTVYDLPPDKSVIRAKLDDTVVVHTKPNCWPTVQFDSTGCSTCVTPDEVEKI